MSEEKEDPGLELTGVAQPSAIKPPTHQQLRDTAASLGLHIDESDEDHFLRLMEASLSSFEWLDKQPDFQPRVKYPRTPGYHPGDAEDKLNAWYVKTVIQGADGGILAGKKLAVKDNICLAGVAMMDGSSVMEGYVADVDATVVERILDAGGTIIGKTHCENLCISGGSHTNSKGPTHNPRRHGYGSGGSSSGSGAVVAAGEADMAIGGDQGGSIRIPASYCGIYGLKPTWGLVPYTGVVGIEHTLDSIGPMTQSTFDNAVLLDAIAGPDGFDARQGPPNHFPVNFDELAGTQNALPAAATNSYAKTLIDGAPDGIKSMRLAVVTEGWRDCEPCVKDGVGRAVEALKRICDVVDEISIPMHAVGGRMWSGVGVSKSVLDQGFGDAHGTGYRGMYVTSLGDFFSERIRSHANELPDNAKRFMLVSKYMNTNYGNHFHAKSQNLVRKLSLEYDRALSKYDLLVMPTLPIVATPLPEPGCSRATWLKKAGEAGSNTAQFNLSGHPAMSIPCAVTKEGLPMGLQLVGRKLDESTIYRAAHAFEMAVSWQKVIVD